MAKKRKFNTVKAIKLTHTRAAMRRITDCLKSNGKQYCGLKHNQLIRDYAELKGLSIPSGASIKDWAINQYKAEKLPDPVKRPRKVKKSKTTKTKPKQKLSVKFCEDLRRRATRAEKRFRTLLGNCKIRHVFQKVIPNSKSFYIVDFFILVRNICVEIDGGYHNDPIQVWKDKQRDQFLSEGGYEVFRFTNEEVMEMNEIQLRNRLSL